MSAAAGWYPDPGGGEGLYRYWDGRVWSAATSAHPGAPAPAQGLVPSGFAGSPSQDPSSDPSGQAAPVNNPYAHYQQVTRKRSAAGWWVGGAALVLAIVVVAVIAIRAVTDLGGSVAGPGVPSGQDSSEVCPPERPETAAPPAQPADGRVHGGPVSYPRLGPPWGAPRPYENRVPFGLNVLTQEVTVESNYQPGKQWVASVLVGELQAGDGFFTPQQGSQIVVRCILGRFYGDSTVTSDVQRDQAATIDGHDAWIVESQLSFDIPGLRTKGELLIVAIVAAGDASSGLYYASIPDTSPELVQPARDALKQLKVDG